MKWTIEKKDAGMLVRDYLRTVRAFSRRVLKAVKDEGRILQNGHDVTVRSILREGDILEVHLPKETKGKKMEPRYMPLEIVYEDSAVLVVNKPAGIPTIPSRRHSEKSLAQGILHYYREKGLSYTVHVVTRLDRDTSGLLLVAKHRFSHSLLARAQKEKEIKRRYKALIEGHLDMKSGTINAPIGRKEISMIEREVRHDGRPAVTHYEVIREFTDFSLVNIRLETGRTHQIRVHFSYIGHPLLGDDLYGGNKKYLGRQALHCDHLSFTHPESYQEMEFSAPLADDLKRVMNMNE
ncbi:23S rRNA pseudouridine1911/1915/1917 synthase [Melghiribacillus thermohalophilus]|uniref:Pseudouridine synthase n=1 Tax=Melghiribacillus thermohalophilus TaxID=1324956 RepID=A0A4R3N066_9BACI|nr:RluA family pseudouridine synthase [Melghiribacillus thermohalophilus]TCT22400.1 23S rRNA pseudouridine1911/1915/1917 synthase [Melghiribacillus thermohalophilus]